ncbi:hypothetical protein [Paraburkholderia phosphatilytica]|uniref:hypothetical protein n=1 Tax=Paraburkholderia phosphatilytica TaxID=2282883 RepID=UPI000F602982|nr:hypothetical protein [Paraburkholderia phosphatilytica]
MDDYAPSVLVAVLNTDGEIRAHRERLNWVERMYSEAHASDRAKRKSEEWMLEMKKAQRWQEEATSIMRQLTHLVSHRQLLLHLSAWLRHVTSRLPASQSGPRRRESPRGG